MWKWSDRPFRRAPPSAIVATHPILLLLCAMPLWYSLPLLQLLGFSISYKQIKSSSSQLQNCHQPNSSSSNQTLLPQTPLDTCTNNGQGLNVANHLLLYFFLLLMKPTGEAMGAIKSREGSTVHFVPVLRSGEWADIGDRQYMEDTHVCIDNFADRFECASLGEGPWAFYGVFDGHGGKHAADFVCDKLPGLIAKDAHFPSEVEKAVRRAFLHTDTAFAEACLSDTGLSSGTTALVAMVVGRYLLVANAGDCRAVLSRHGKAIEMSRDHKPTCSKEKKRIEASRGYVDDGYLNGQLTVTRALGDWHMEGMKANSTGGGGPLSAEPELKRITLTEEDEFLIIGCDGLWDVFRSQNAVDFARRKLQEHNDPLLCCKELVDEALKRKAADNLTVVVVCFKPEAPASLVAPRSRVQRSISAEGLQSLKCFLESLRD